MMTSLKEHSMAVCLAVLVAYVTGLAIQNPNDSKLNVTSSDTQHASLTFVKKTALTNRQPYNGTETSNIDSTSDISEPETAEVYEPVSCPTSKCKCTKDLDQNPPYLQINCRYENLVQIPIFNVTSVIYDEITFSMANNITVIPNGAFRNLQVRQIDLEKNNINVFEDGAFFGLDKVLKTLYLQGNGANPIPYHIISNLASLTKLKLTNFQEDRIPGNNNLGSFEKLEILELHQIKGLTAVDPQAFKNKLPLLQELVFNTVEFNDIPVAALQQLQDIRKLGIHNTQISTIYANSFANYNFQRLSELDLRSNKISLIQSDAFANVCESLEILDLTDNYLNQTSLSAFQTKTWKKLHTLNLSYNNRIGSITSSVFENMPRLQYLILMDINLRSISTNMFTGLHNLNTLELSYNRIVGIHNGAFSSMPVLKDLRLGYQTYEDPFQAKELDLYPAILTGITNSLTALSLEGTPLHNDHFWRTVQILSSLETLQISETGLKLIPDNAFVHNTKLSAIELGRNHIKELSDSAFRGLENSLVEVMLQSNKLMSISKCVFKDLTKLHTLMLVSNPLHCDCKLVWLHDFIMKKFEEDPTFPRYNYMCASPVELQNKFLFNINVTALKCHMPPEVSCQYVTEAVNPATTTSKSIVTSPNVTDITSTKASTILSLYVGGATETSITLYWNILGNEEQIKGFRLEYSSVVDNVKLTIPIHQEMRGFEITGLKPDMFYKICVILEYLTKTKSPVEDCKTRQTLSQKPKYEGYKEEGTNNTIVIVLVTTVIVVVLIIAGLYMLVKYKIQKLREIRLTMASPGMGRFDPSMAYCGEEESSTCATPNEYTEVQAARLAQKNKLYSSKQMQRQFAMDNPYHERGYSTYHKIKATKRQKQHEEPAGKDDKDDENYTEVSEQVKTDVVQRHSAPCRLDAGELMKTGKLGQARPLPATPTDNVKAEKSGIPKEHGNHVFMTQASVYENKLMETIDTVEEDKDIGLGTIEEDKQEKIYHEISGNDTLPRT